jgi:hypothetical protein
MTMATSTGAVDQHYCHLAFTRAPAEPTPTPVSAHEQARGSGTSIQQVMGREED